MYFTCTEQCQPLGSGQWGTDFCFKSCCRSRPKVVKSKSQSRLPASEWSRTHRVLEEVCWLERLIGKPYVSQRYQNGKMNSISFSLQETGLCLQRGSHISDNDLNPYLCHSLHLAPGGLFCLQTWVKVCTSYRSETADTAIEQCFSALALLIFGAW